MRNSVGIGRIAGVRVGLHWSLPFVAVLLAVGLAVGNLPSGAPGYSPWAYGLAGSVAAVIFLAGVLIHELGHAVVARRQGLTVDGITLWLLGGLTRIDGDPASPGAELRLSGSGPLLSLLLGLGLGGLGLGLGALGWSPLVAAVLDWLGVINVALAVFNVLPGAPLDGGRLLHAALWRRNGDRLRATETVSRAGWALGMVLIVLGIVGVILGAVGGLWIALVGWFLMTASRAEVSQARMRYDLDDLRAVDIMTPDPALAPDWITVQAFIDEYVRGVHPGSFPVEKWQGGSSGLVTLGQLRSVPHQERSFRRVADVAWPLSSVAIVGPKEPAIEVARRLAGVPSQHALVIDAERLVGIVTPTDLMRTRHGHRPRGTSLVASGRGHLAG
jgi:Zn-dependent protease/CBS domain-containing protein